MIRIVILALALVAALGAQADTRQRVLLLHSYHAGLGWTDAIQRGFDESLRTSGVAVDVYVEHLDSLRFRSRLSQMKFGMLGLLRAKFAGTSFDAVVVADNDAFDFVLANREFFGTAVPVVFCGINGLDAYDLSRYSPVTGVAEAASFGDTLTVIADLFRRPRLVVIGDRSATFQANIEGLRRANEGRLRPFQVEVFNDPSLRRILAHVAAIGPDASVFFMSRPVDDEGVTVSMPQAVHEVTQASRQPVFAGWDFMLGHGVIGGSMVSGEAQGRAAAAQLAAILRGTPVAAVPVLHKSPNQYMFDHRALVRFGVQDAALPEGAVIIERPVSFYEANREKVQATAAAFAVLLIVLAVLSVEIVRRRRAEVQLGYLARHDVLTGLTNRGLLQDRFTQALALAERNNRALALLFLDLDRFKEINDSLGHSIGDKVLRDVAARLTPLVRNSDTICRIGGDEYVLLLNQLDRASESEAAAIADKVVAAMARPFDVAGNVLNLSFSIGIAVYPWDGRDFETLLKNADIAMYEAKSGGRNSVRFFSESMNVRIQRRMRCLQHLAGAREKGELSLHIQPQQSLGDGSIVGAEALLRWNSSVLGQVSPAEFIPYAESSGAIVGLGEWVFEEVCRIVARWQKLGLPAIPLAVNVSVVQLRRAGFSDFVRGCLERHGITPARLEIEITESVFLDTLVEISRNLEALQSMGLMLAIDDFGTGYSNLSYLKRTSASRLKIDQSFVKDLLSDANCAEIVRAVVQIGRSIGMKTVAEGVEEPGQAVFLRDLGCDAMQGYLLSPPVPVETFEAFFERFRARHQLTVVEGASSSQPIGGQSQRTHSR
jgi:diguanylate cyclase (GGDEF)-like protein